ncbi:MAG: 3'-5' exonuclease [Opitutaceae bacterium]
MTLPTFTAIDFETAQPDRASICQVGLVRYEQGVITYELSLLVRPPDNSYWSRFTEIHGLSWEDTVDEPSFAEVWPQVCGFIEGQTVVAHNISFDGSCLRKTLEFHGLDEPTYEPQCTYRIYGRGLAKLCDEYAIPLNHHDALSDARACGELYLRHLGSAAVS